MNFDSLAVKLFFFTLLLWPLSRLWLRYKDGSVKTGMFLFWNAVWIGGVFALFFPGFLTFVAQEFSIGRGSDFVIYISLAVLFYLVFRVTVVIENVHNDISKIVRQIALQKLEYERHFNNKDTKKVNKKLKLNRSETV